MKEAETEEIMTNTVQMWLVRRTTNLQTLFKCFINQLNPELELLILPGTSADQSSQLNEKFTIVLLVQ